MLYIELDISGPICTSLSNFIVTAIAVIYFVRGNCSKHKNEVIKMDNDSSSFDFFLNLFVLCTSYFFKNNLSHSKPHRIIIVLPYTKLITFF